MGKSAFEIRMDYNRAIQQADTLLQIAKDLKGTANTRIEECSSQIAYNWEGVNASTYLRKCADLKQKIAKTADSLERTAETIKQMAKNTYDAEMKALELANVRTY